MQHGKADGIKHRVWCTEIIQEHYEETMVGQLVEITMTTLVVTKEHMGNCYQYLGENMIIQLCV